jgi:hypothetical protein
VLLDTLLEAGWTPLPLRSFRRIGPSLEGSLRVRVRWAVLIAPLPEFGRAPMLSGTLRESETGAPYGNTISRDTQMPPTMWEPSGQQAPSPPAYV